LASTNTANTAIAEHKRSTQKAQGEKKAADNAIT
jgi:hypothetical protein